MEFCLKSWIMQNVDNVQYIIRRKIGIRIIIIKKCLFYFCNLYFFSFRRQSIKICSVQFIMCMKYVVYEVTWREGGIVFSMIAKDQVLWFSSLISVGLAWWRPVSVLLSNTVLILQMHFLLLKKVKICISLLVSSQADDFFSLPETWYIYYFYDFNHIF